MLRSSRRSTALAEFLASSHQALPILVPGGLVQNASRFFVVNALYRRGAPVPYSRPQMRRDDLEKRGAPPRRRTIRKLRTKIERGGAGPALVEVSMRLHLDDAGHVSKASVTIPERIKMSEDAFRGSVANQLRQLADLIAAAKADDLVNPLAWPLVQFAPPAHERNGA